jgi:FixJ family two-component response regulator
MKMMSNQQKTIAVVDDDPEMRCAMRNLLSALGYIGKTYDTAKTFLNCASTCEASCLVLDIQLGDISGIELALRLAADGFRFPIIFMTGLDDATIRNQAVAAGGIALLRKPFSAETLADAITKAVDARLSIPGYGQNKPRFSPSQADIHSSHQRPLLICQGQRDGCTDSALIE